MFHPNRKTKIIATFGPACSTRKTLTEMLKEGVDLIRLNASHQSDPVIIQKQVRLIRSCAKSISKHVGIFLDLQGHLS